MQNNQIAQNLEEIIKAAQSGDMNAFRKIVVEHQPYAYAVAFRFLCEESDAEDVVQESFIRIWNHLKEFDVKKKFTTWMYKIIVNLCFDKAKSTHRRNRLFERLDIHSSETKYVSEIHIEEEFAVKETVGFIKYFANGLSEKQRMIFLLRDMQDLTIQEVADITGMSESGIKANLFFARQNIRKKLAKLEASV
jgi:RNA polymerase sigma-70 factor, ECF subfamily